MTSCALGPGPCRVTFIWLLGPRALGGFACVFGEIKKVISAAWDGWNLST